MSVYKYVKFCKCGKRFLSKDSKKKKCPTCETIKKKIKRKKCRISNLDKKLIYLRDHFCCRICHKDLSANPRDCCCVKIKGSNYYITVDRADIKLAKRLRIEELSQFG